MNEQQTRDLLDSLSGTVTVGPPRVQATVVEGRGRRRRRRGTYLGVFAAAAVAVTAGMFAVGPGDDNRSLSPTRDNRGGATVSLDAYAYDWGLHLLVRVTFDSARGLDDGYFEAGAAKYPVQFWTAATDCDCDYPDPLPAHAGEQVLIEATSALPDCAAQPSETVGLVVTSRLPDGTTEVDRFTASNPGVYADAVDEWCARPASLMLSQSSITLDGDAHVRIRAINPGSDDIVIETPALDAGTVHWSASRTLVPGGATVEIRIEGTGIQCDDPVHGTTTILPWIDGQLTVDGEPTPFPGGEQWC